MSWIKARALSDGLHLLEVLCSQLSSDIHEINRLSGGARGHILLRLHRYDARGLASVVAAGMRLPGGAPVLTLRAIGDGVRIEPLASSAAYTITGRLGEEEVMVAGVEGPPNPAISLSTMSRKLLEPILDPVQSA